MRWSHRLKLDHAIEHLYALEAVQERWSQTNPCVVREDCEVQTRKHRVFVELVTPPSGALIPLRLGDCVHNMRQALDHFAYKLSVSLHGCDPPPNGDNTGFPITTTEANFKDAPYGKIAPKKLMPKALYAGLKEVQPHPGRDQHLWVLHQLDNIDKHRFAPVVAGIAQGHSFHIGTFTGSHFVGPRLGPLEPETPVVEYIPAPDTEVDMNLAFSAGIALAKTSTVAPGQFVLPLLSAIRFFILRKVFEPLEDFL